MLRLLILEDTSRDVDTLLRVLKKSGLDFEYAHVDNKIDYTTELSKDQLPDIILSDYDLPTFSGKEAFKILNERQPHIPFIFITSALRDTIAAEMLQLGIDDYVFKDRLKRLPSAIQQAIARRKLLNEKEEALLATKKSERKFFALASMSPVGIFQVDKNGQCIYVNKKYTELAGLSKNEALGTGWFSAVHKDDRKIVLDAWQELLSKSKSSVSVEYRFVKNTGEIIWVLGQADVEQDGDHNMMGYIGTITDITNQKLARLDLVKREKKYRDLYENATDEIIIIDVATYRILDANPTLYENTGYDKGEVLGQPISILIAQENIPEIEQRVAQALVREKLSFISKHRRKDQSLYPVEVVAKIIEHDGKKVLQAFVRDITQRVEAEKEIVKLSRVASQIDNAVIITNAQGMIEWVNTGFEKLTGYKSVEVIGKKPGDFLQGPRTDPQAVMAIRQSLQRAEPFTTEILNYNSAGLAYWITLSITPQKSPDGKLEKFIGISTDITATKNTQNEIEQSYKELKAIEEINTLSLADQSISYIANEVVVTFQALEPILDGWVYLFDEKKQLRCMNKGFNDGISKQAGTSINFPERIPVLLSGGLIWKAMSDKRAQITRDKDDIIDLSREFTENHTVHSHLVESLTGSGVKSSIIIPVSSRRDAFGVIILIHSRVLPIKMIERFERITNGISAALAKVMTEEKSKRLAKIVSNSNEAIISVGLNGAILSWNKSAAELFGYTSEEILGEPLGILSPPEHLERAREATRKVVRENVSVTIEAIGLRKNQRRVPIELSIFPIINDHGKITSVSGIVRDIRERKKIEKERKDFTKKLETQVLQRTSELSDKNSLLSRKNKDITDSINYALRLQKALFPDKSILQDFFQDAFVYLRPRDIVSGDFYWFHKRKGKFIIVAADCTGHGVPGAFMSVLGIELLNKIIVQEGASYPTHILELLDDGLVNVLGKADGENVTDGIDMAICSIDTNSGQMDFAGAGRPIILISDEGLSYVKGSKFSLGGVLSTSIKKYETASIDFSSGDMLYLFSDGYVDQFGGKKGKKIMSKRLKEQLEDIHNLPCANQRDCLDRYLIDWMGGEDQVDDILIMGVRLM